MEVLAVHCVYYFCITLHKKYKSKKSLSPINKQKRAAPSSFIYATCAGKISRKLRVIPMAVSYFKTSQNNTK